MIRGGENINTYNELHDFKDAIIDNHRGLVQYYLLPVHNGSKTYGTTDLYFVPHHNYSSGIHSLGIIFDVELITGQTLPTDYDKLTLADFCDYIRIYVGTEMFEEVTISSFEAMLRGKKVPRDLHINKTKVSQLKDDEGNILGARYYYQIPAPTVFQERANLSLIPQDANNKLKIELKKRELGKIWDFYTTNAITTENVIEAGSTVTFDPKKHMNGTGFNFGTLSPKNLMTTLGVPNKSALILAKMKFVTSKITSNMFVGEYIQPEDLSLPPEERTMKTDEGRFNLMERIAIITPGERILGFNHAYPHDATISGIWIIDEARYRSNTVDSTGIAGMNEVYPNHIKGEITASINGINYFPSLDTEVLDLVDTYEMSDYTNGVIYLGPMDQTKSNINTISTDNLDFDTDPTSVNNLDLQISLAGVNTEPQKIRILVLYRTTENLVN